MLAERQENVSLSKILVTIGDSRRNLCSSSARKAGWTERGTASSPISEFLFATLGQGILRAETAAWHH